MESKFTFSADKLSNENGKLTLRLSGNDKFGLDKSYINDDIGYHQIMNMNTLLRIKISELRF